MHLPVTRLPGSPLAKNLRLWRQIIQEAVFISDVEHFSIRSSAKMGDIFGNLVGRTQENFGFAHCGRGRLVFFTEKQKHTHTLYPTQLNNFNIVMTRSSTYIGTHEQKQEVNGS